MYGNFHTFADTEQPNRLLAYKLMSACNLKDWTSTSVLEKARFGDKDGKVFERTRKAILYYHDISCTRRE